MTARLAIFQESPTALSNPPPEPERETISIAVHGTFDSQTADNGVQWWQISSPFSKLLSRFLPARLRHARSGEVFHWSGENSERARNQAAGELLRHLKRVESEGKSYHLIGHSHGGSVIWHTLKLAMHTRTTLAGLKSWTTVGTPFLRHRSNGAFSLSNLMAIVLALLLLKPAITNGAAFCKLSLAALSNARPELIMSNVELGSYDSILRSPFTRLTQLLGVPMENVPGKGLKIGSFSPESDTHLATYLFGSIEGLTIMSVMLLACYVFTILTLHAFAPALESHRIRAEEKLEDRAFRRFGDGWLGIWSPNDEAINGLRATLHIDATFVRQMLPRNRVFISDTPSLLYKPIVMLFSPIFNRFLRPFLNQRVRNIVVRSAQGNDRPAAELIAVTPTPVDMPNSEMLALPSSVDHQLVETADRHARELAPKLRRLLAQPSFAMGIGTFSSELTGSELIHTAYFEHESIAAIIAAHIAMQEFIDSGTLDQPVVPHEASMWVAEAKRRMESGPREDCAHPSEPAKRAA